MNEDKQVCVTVVEENEVGLNENTSIAGAGLVSYMNENIHNICTQLN